MQSHPAANTSSLVHSDPVANNTKPSLAHAQPATNQSAVQNTTVQNASAAAQLSHKLLHVNVQPVENKTAAVQIKHQEQPRQNVSLPQKTAQHHDAQQAQPSNQTSVPQLLQTNIDLHLEVQPGRTGKPVTNEDRPESEVRTSHDLFHPDNSQHDRNTDTMGEWHRLYEDHHFQGAGTTGPEHHNSPAKKGVFHGDVVAQEHQPRHVFKEEWRSPLVHGPKNDSTGLSLAYLTVDTEEAATRFIKDLFKNGLVTQV